MDKGTSVTGRVYTRTGGPPRVPDRLSGLRESPALDGGGHRLGGAMRALFASSVVEVGACLTGSARAASEGCLEDICTYLEPD